MSKQKIFTLCFTGGSGITHYSISLDRELATSVDVMLVAAHNYYDQGYPQKSQMLDTIEKNNNVPLVALWVFDFSFQDTSYNVAATNERAYQLNMVAQDNARIRTALCVSNPNNC